MAIHETRKQSDLEKRLKLLRQQIYGKSSEPSENSVSQKSQYIRTSDNPTDRHIDTLIPSGTPSHSESFRIDISYLYHDLIKIAIISGLAIGTQIILFILVSNNILNLNFF